jgi:tetratricopeptide (TPR) repeat protein
LGHVINRSPKFADVHYLIGLVFEHEHDLENAARSLEQAISINPSYKNAGVKLATVYIKMERFQEALDTFQATAKQAADDPGLKLAVDMIRKRLEKTSPDPAEIGRALEEVLGDTGSISGTIEAACCQIDILPHFKEMISLVNAVGNTREALPITQVLVSHFEDHVNTHPTYPDLRHSLGILYLRLNRLNEAAGAFKEAVRLNPNYIKARIDLLKTLKRIGDIDQALVHGEFVLSKGIKYPDVFVTIGELEYARQRYDNALAHAENALAAKPTYAAAYYLTGQVLEQKGKYQEATAAYSQCLQLDSPQGLKRDAQEGINRLLSKGK